MRETDRIANEKFNGDKFKAIEYITRYYDDDTLIQIIRDEWDKEEAQHSADILYKMAVENKGKEAVDRVINNSTALNNLNLSREEVLNAEKNPYKAGVMKGFLRLLIINGTLIATLVASKTFGIEISENLLNVLQCGSSILNTYVAIDFVAKITDYFKFKKLKKNLELEEEFDKNEKITGGKSL